MIIVNDLYVFMICILLSVTFAMYFNGEIKTFLLIIIIIIIIIQDALNPIVKM